MQDECDDTISPTWNGVKKLADVAAADRSAARAVERARGMGVFGFGGTLRVVKVVTVVAVAHAGRHVHGE